MAQNVGVGRQLVNAAMAAPFLERGEEHDLAVRWRQAGDEHALHELAASHMRLVIAIAVRFRHYGLSVADLVQEGHVGLLEAAARFDPDRDVRFSTYATWWIRASIQDYVLRNWSIVRGGTSSAQKALFFNLRRLRNQLSRGGRESNSHVFTEIARSLGVARADVETMNARLAGPDVSLNVPVGDGEMTTGAERVDFLIDDKPLPDEIASQSIDTDRRTHWLRDALDGLSDRELRILHARRLSDEATTLEALGERLGISKERVRQIEGRALDKLRRALTRRHPKDVVEAMT